jgi:tRNA1(Val) A37 N6-methylase TrmN6
MIMYHYNKTLKRSNLLFYQPQSGYCYNSDTVFLYDFARRFIKKGSVVDIGAGCGVLGFLLKQSLPINLTSIELQSEVFRLCEKNAEVNSIEATLLNTDFLEFEASSRYDFFVSNPPFYHTSTLKGESKNLSLSRHSSSLPFKSMLKKINSMIAPKGEFIFCYEARSLGEIVENLSEYNFKVANLRFIHPKASKEATIFLCRAKKSGNPQLKVEPPLVVFDKKSEYVDEVALLYKKLQTHTIKCEL